MDAKAMTTAYRMTQWAGLLQERAASGESITAFCKARGIRRNTYFYWQRKLREAACAEITKQESKTLLAPSGWTMLTTLEPPQAENSLTIEVSGCRVTATCETDLELLAKVCRVLKTL